MAMIPLCRAALETDGNKMRWDGSDGSFDESEEEKGKREAR
jgi:hypothetical protein